MSERTKCDCPDTVTIGVEYPYSHPQRYDGVSEWQCRQCGNRVGRWSGKLLAKGQCEKRFDTPKEPTQ